MEKEKERQLWTRAELITQLADVKQSTSNEIEDECEMRRLVNLYKESEDTQILLKRCLVDLYSDRAKYIEIFESLLKEAKRHEDSQLWKEIVSIIGEESKTFVKVRRGTRK